MPVASAAASPPLEAPGVRDRSHGLTVAPYSSLSQTQPTPYVGRLASIPGAVIQLRLRPETQRWRM